MKKIKIAPSILSVDFGRLNEEIKDVEKAGADLIHIDVMDGHFVPNITIGPLVIKHLKTKLPLDVHLMINNPENYLEAFARANRKVKTIIIHYELVYNNRQSLTGLSQQIKSFGKKAGLAVNPSTPFEAFRPFIPHFDMILLMTVEPGFAAQKFIKGVLPKIEALQEIVPRLDMAVDGGINTQTVRMAVEAGANILVAGNAIFGQKNRKKAIASLREIANQPYL